MMGVDITDITISIVMMLIGTLLGWFLHRSASNSKSLKLLEAHEISKNKLQEIKTYNRDIESEKMRFQFETEEVIKKLNNKNAKLEKQCQALKTDNSDLLFKNSDIARKITQLYQAKQSEITKLKDKIELAKSHGEIAVTSKQEIQFLKRTVQRLENLIMDESRNYEEHISELESQLSQIQPINLMQSPAEIVSDDLTEISGIGPKLQEFLREFGITSFHQLANMSDSELGRLSEELGDFSDRVVRDNWVEQARQLSQYKN